MAGQHKEENGVQLVFGWGIFTLIKDVVIAARRREHQKWKQEEIPGSGSEKVERRKSVIPKNCLTFLITITTTTANE